MRTQPTNVTPRGSLPAWRGPLAVLLTAALLHATLPRAQAEESTAGAAATNAAVSGRWVSPSLLVDPPAAYQQPPIADPDRVAPSRGRRAGGLALGLAGLGLIGLGSYLAATGFWVEEGYSTPGSCRTQYVRMPYPWKDSVQVVCTPGRVVKWPEAHTARGTAGIITAGVGFSISLAGFRMMKKR